MRIGFDAKRAFHNFRGLGNYSRTLLENLARFSPDNEYLLFTPESKDVRALQWKRAHPQFEVVTPDTAVGKVFSSAWRSLFLGKTLNRFKLDIYHGLSHEIPPGIEFENYRKVVTIHDLIFLRHPEFFPTIDRFVYLKKFKYACEKSDLIIAICEQTKNDVMEFFNIPEEKIKVVYQSCSSNFLEKLTQEEMDGVIGKYGISKGFILYVGAIEERKNALGLLKAYVRSGVEQKLVLIGRGKSYLNQVREYILKEKLQNRVTILENVPIEELPAFYQAARLFCWPSHFEGFGIPIIESLFSGTPVITSQGSCFPESGGGGAIYVDPNDIDQLAFEISHVLNDDVLYRDLVTKGKDHIQKFEAETTSRALLSVYRQLRN